MTVSLRRAHTDDGRFQGVVERDVVRDDVDATRADLGTARTLSSESLDAAAFYTALPTVKQLEAGVEAEAVLKNMERGSRSVRTSHANRLR
jgi:hypothetical protein